MKAITDVLTRLTKENPDVPGRDMQSIVQLQYDVELTALAGRAARYDAAAARTYERLSDWLKTGNEYAVDLDWRDIASFMLSHQPACVICVMIAKARAVRK